MEFFMVLFVFPLISFAFGIVGQIVLNKIYLVVGISLIGWVIATFTLFNGSFLMWVFIYSVLSLAGAGIVYLAKKFKNK